MGKVCSEREAINLEIRRVNEKEFTQAIQLADKTFRKAGHCSMGEAFPQVFSNELGLSYGAFDDGKLVSFIGLVPSQITIGEAVLNVFSIGAVCTDEAYRKQGISTAILKEVYAYINDAGGTLLFISGDRGLYKRNHCYYFGKLSKYTIEKMSFDRSKSFDGLIRRGNKEDIFQLDKLRKKKYVRYENSIWEWNMLFEAGGYASIFMMDQALYIAEKNGSVTGYVVVGLPKDVSSFEHGIITDWGGETASIKGILTDLLQTNTVPRIEISVSFQDELNHELCGFKKEDMKNAGTIYIVNPEKLLEQLNPYFQEKGLEHELKVEELDDDHVLFTSGTKARTLSRGELVALLFDVGEKPDGLDVVFPIPLPGTQGMNYV